MDVYVTSYPAAPAHPRQGGGRQPCQPFAAAGEAAAYVDVRGQPLRQGANGAHLRSVAPAQLSVLACVACFACAGAICWLAYVAVCTRACLLRNACLVSFQGCHCAGALGYSCGCIFGAPPKPAFVACVRSENKLRE
eukprot:361405-Chlamydomonas_euryale.AAC.2